MNIGISMVWILLDVILLSFQVHCLQPDERCEEVRKTHHDACGLFDYTDDRPLACSSGDVTTEEKCSKSNCCWHKNNCYSKPVKCYLDFRLERCYKRQRVTSASGVYEGYSINGTHCFIDNMQYFFERFSEDFRGATSEQGVRILGPNELDESCVYWIETDAKQLSDGNCTVDFVDKKYPSMNGTMRASKCVTEVNNGFYIFDEGVSNSCVCHMDAWVESKTERLTVSNTIRQYVEEQESRSSCSQILGRLVRDSWRNRLDIVNNAEVGVVVNALLNITNEKASEITKDDAFILLDTSEQLSKYKFYEGLENDSADFLIQSSTKILSNLMKSVATSTSNFPENPMTRSTDPAALLDVPDQLTTYVSDSLQWKIMNNLEGIAENAASLITLHKEESKYVVEAREDTVSLQVAIARPRDLKLLTNFSHSTANESTGFRQEAQVADFSNYEKDDDDENLAIITIFYDVPEENKNTSSRRRASEILAINLRSVKDGMVKKKHSLPVLFTLQRSNNSCEGECEDVCVFTEQSHTNKGEIWEQRGCHVNSTGDNFTTCYCNHTTHFAVLMQPTRGDDAGDPTISEFDTRVLELLSIALGSISVAALAATMIIFIVYRRILLKDRMLIHLHLVIALMCGYVTFLSGSMFSDQHFNMPGPCFGAAIASHLFFLSTFFWSLMEGIYLFYKVVMVFSNKWAEWSAKYAPVPGWIFPIVIVTTSVIVSRFLETTDLSENYDNYYNIHTCFLQQSNGMIWSFMGPVLVIIAINSFVLIKVILVIFRSSLSSSKKTKTTEQEKVTHSLRNSAKGAVLLMPILGVPWIVNVFVKLGDLDYTAGVVSAYIHVVLMGLQGVEIFLFYCVFNTEVRNAYKLSAERRRSMASIETTTKNRKRSRAPLLATSKESSPESIRYKNSLTVSSTGRTLTGTTLIMSAPTTPQRCNTLPAVEEHQC